MLGDGGGSNIIARDNVVVNPGGYGMAITGGTNMQLINNKIFSINTAITNNAIPVWSWEPEVSRCTNPIVRGNQVNWTNGWGQDIKIWGNNTCTNPQFSNNKFSDPSITAQLFDTYVSPECK